MTTRFDLCRSPRLTFNDRAVVAEEGSPYWEVTVFGVRFFLCSNCISHKVLFLLVGKSHRGGGAESFVDQLACTLTF